ncbi:hypothetical protein D5085_17405 [Ectothiorhodospiraceae bacterium BW-2]|nr:hypothetical protein D5085_17405 [Ectothiorhodospiraceae bacterium BW-2]
MAVIDALGRKTGQSDESGRTTHYEYDPKARLHLNRRINADGGIA